MPLQPAPPSRLSTGSAGWSRDRWFRVALVALAAAQLGAFWLLCSQQVRKAEMRDMSLEVRRVAVADCLQYIPGSTIASCTSRTAANPQPAQPADHPAATGAVPVSFSYR